MFFFARFTRFKAGEYGTYFDKTYANTVLSNLDWNIVYISVCEWLVCVVCVLSKTELPENPRHMGHLETLPNSPFFQIN